MNLNNISKKQLYIGAGVLLILGIVTMLPLVLPSSKPSTMATLSPTPEPINSTTSGGNTFPNQTVTSSQKEVLSPEETARRFYLWYVAETPLKTGAYNTRIDITDEYKAVMNKYVRRGLSADRDDVFNCGDAVLPRNVSPQNAEYQGDLSLVMLQEIPGNRNLFIIKLQNVDAMWKVRDVWCAP